ncbi:RsiW-degrading membrane proteinase PrsW (M82 family) [Tenacibaculum adriaticum]|uniref:Protease PrsW n=1 Tax=Tenacibaculum adriaticum TaxID=413713 RepID=A0A5S5DQ48_9FLAO|nr:PrsW family glutamic-type intramembrane protease [Tenacibaculum adriaticum]TYP98070.1 RsiW-degrading membrane proteinase PrsW (M82 family) [Tenacibaculum adriaticum]
MNLLLLAVAPAMIIVAYIYLKDKFEKEPINFLIKNFVLGAIVSILVTIILGAVLNGYFIVTDSRNIIQILVKAFVVVGFVEEFSKYIIVRYYAQTNKEFNEPFDGIVYAVMVSMGFATLENVLYVFQYGAGTGIIRAFTAVPAHATFAILMGFFMGKAKFSKNKRLFNLIGLLLAILFHGAYDFFLFIDFVPGISVGAFVSLLTGFFLANKAINVHQKVK